jgi:hypothetical protein
VSGGRPLRKARYIPPPRYQTDFTPEAVSP